MADPEAPRPLRLLAAVGPDGALAADSSDGLAPWWSFTKTLIAAAALRLSDQGRLVLDEPVGEHPYTLRQLLQHRAGVGDYGRLEAYQQAIAAGAPPWSDEELFAHVPPGKLSFPPGQGRAYSNVGYLLVRRRLEDVCAAPLGRLLDDLVLGPLGIAGARVAETPQDLAGAALPAPTGYDPGWVFHGLLVGPTSAAALALHRLLAGTLLSTSSRAAMLEGGVGLMIRTARAFDGGPALQLAGHGAAGPGSVGAVYHVTSGGLQATAAAFAAGDDEALADRLAAARVLQVAAG